MHSKKLCLPLPAGIVTSDPISSSLSYK